MKIFKHKKVKLPRPSLAWWKLRNKLIHMLGGETHEETSSRIRHSYERGKIIGQAEAAIYIKDYMKSLWEDKRWEDKAYKQVSKFLERELPKQYHSLKENLGK